VPNAYAEATREERLLEGIWAIARNMPEPLVSGVEVAPDAYWV